MPFLKNCWYVVGFPNEFGEKPLRRQIAGEYMALFRDADGKACAIEDRCPHRFVPLSMGQLEGCQIRCGYHGLAFDIHNGDCVERPMDDGPMPPKLRIKIYAVAEKYDLVWAWLGEADAADPATIPDFSIVSDPTLQTVSGYLKIEANVQLVVDNLLDLSHVQFLHAQIAAKADLTTYQSHVEQDGATVWQRLLRPNIVPNPFQMKMWGSNSTHADSVGDVRWNPPGVLAAFTSITEVGAPPEEGMRIPSAHLLTPETEFSTHYFWATGRSHAREDTDLDTFLKATVSNVFTTQDAPMIEEQQKAMGNTTDFLAQQPVILKADAAGIRARRVMKRLLSEERDQTNAIAAE